MSFESGIEFENLIQNTPSSLDLNTCLDVFQTPDMCMLDVPQQRREIHPWENEAERVRVSPYHIPLWDSGNVNSLEPRLHSAALTKPYCPSLGDWKSQMRVLGRTPAHELDLPGSQVSEHPL